MSGGKNDQECLHSHHDVSQTTSSNWKPVQLRRTVVSLHTVRKASLYLDTLVVAVGDEHLPLRRGSHSLQVGKLPFISSLCS